MMDVREVTTDEDVETLRQIRNSGRQWMTRNTAEITPEQQRDWWANFNRVATGVWLFSVASTDVGYGLLKLENGRVWCSLAVLPRHQGYGYGTEIYRWLALRWRGRDIWAEIYADNTPSIRAALRAGFQIAYAADKTATLVYRR